MDRGKFVILYGVLIFLVGFILGFVWNSYSNSWVTGFAVGTPSNFVVDKNILIYPDKVVILVDGAKISNYGATGSMLPTLGSETNGISVVPKSEDEIGVGDIVTFKRGEELIVHRVVDKGVDAQGTYFVTKGDSSPVSDGKIRFSDIERVLVGLIY